MEVTAEGVQYEYIPENSSEVPAGGLTLGGSISVPGKLKFDLNHKFNDKVKLSGSVAVTIPDVSCKLDAGFRIKSGNPRQFNYRDESVNCAYLHS